MSAEAVKGLLLPDEAVLWAGRPAQGLLLTRQDWLLVPFSLLWGGFSVFWEVGVLSTGAPWFMALLGVPFVLIGAYLIAGRFIVDAWVRRKTCYALTDRRILISRSAPFGKIVAMFLDRLPEAHLTLSAHGGGTIRFGQRASLFSNQGSLGAWAPALESTPQFLAIDDAQAVFDMVQRAMRGAA